MYWFRHKIENPSSYIEFDNRIFDINDDQLHIHRKTIRPFAFSVIPVHEGSKKQKIKKMEKKKKKKNETQ